MGKLYPTLAGNPDYSSIVNERHYARLAGLLADAKSRGARFVEVNPAGETFDPASASSPRRSSSTSTPTWQIMREEIFGPLLPVVPYDTLDDAIDYVNAHDRPLALYWFGDNRARRDRVLRDTIAGGVTVNGCLTHFAQEAQPFGGVGASGTGSYHGVYGFRTFSKEKAVYYQRRLGIVPLLMPPYGKLLDRGAASGSSVEIRIRERRMNFDYTPKVRELRERLHGVHDGARLSERAPLPRRGRGQSRERQSVDSDAARRGAQGRGASRVAVEPLPAAIGARRGTHQPRIRAAVRADGPRHVGARGLQLQRARYRQHGDDRALRHARAQAAVARAAARGRDPVGIPDDRARGRLVGRHQHRMQHGARRRRLRDQRPQMVVVGRRRSALRASTS